MAAVHSATTQVKDFNPGSHVMHVVKRSSKVFNILLQVIFMNIHILTLTSRQISGSRACYAAQGRRSKRKVRSERNVLAQISGDTSTFRLE